MAGFPKTLLLSFSSLLQSITPDRTRSGLGSFPFARRYSENRCFFLFLRVLRCFSSPGYLLIGYVFTYGYLSITLSEFPHSEICGLSDICSCPQLIAACHVLRRLLVPRHPPCALLHLTSCLSFVRFAALLLASCGTHIPEYAPFLGARAPCESNKILRKFSYLHQRYV